MLFQPRFVQMVFPVEGLELLFAEDSLVNNHFFFRLHFATSGSASETNHVQGLVSGIRGPPAMGPKGDHECTGKPVGRGLATKG
jgi:hypothetical protein